MAKCSKCGKETSMFNLHTVGVSQVCDQCLIPSEFNPKIESMQQAKQDLIDMKRREEDRKNEIEELILRKPYLIDSIIITSVFSLEGKAVKKYFDFITAEAVIGTGIFSEFDASISDFFGVRGSSFEKKLKKAKEHATKQLKQDAFRLGANYILGADIDYMEIGNNMLMVTISGTPAIIE